MKFRKKKEAGGWTEFDLPWRVKYKRLKAVNHKELLLIRSRHRFEPVHENSHKVSIAANIWASCAHNDWHVPIGLGSMFQALMYAPEVFSPSLLQVVFGDNRPWEDPGGITTANVSSATLASALRVYGGFRLLEVSDSPPWYSFSEGLAYSLLATETSYQVDEVKLPYPAVVFEYPPNFMRLRLSDGWYTFRAAVMMSEQRVKLDENKGRGFLVNCYYVPDEGKTCDVVAFTYTLCAELSEDKFEEHLDWQASMSEEPAGKIPGNKGGEIDGHQVNPYEFCRVTLSLLWSSVLYFNSQDADVLYQPARLTKARKRKRGGVPVRVEKDLSCWDEFLVGSTVRVDPLIKRAAVYGVESEGTSTAEAHAVCGHFKMQPCGTGRQERRRIWVKPYVRNRENSEHIVGHTYKLA